MPDRVSLDLLWQAITLCLKVFWKLNWQASGQSSWALGMLAFWMTSLSLGEIRLLQ